ncbi:MalY/PatB family protein [Propionispora hippei]|uniref:cysteine-S-conjugate beta-lyase n=1 Tax=Propionispora hippei DSM 15287 TaxID=1123003 RepID=A0A1M6F8F3_9FIRM|nr:PatB family C-S lyase [Propionispora hippei]SHI94034.1 cystathione beta-lyase [Propionispora hippei DSM 15287]
MSATFDEIIDRRRTNCRKWDAACQLFGNDEVLPMWIADMDFAVPAAVARAVQERADHEIYGYPHKEERFYQAIQNWLLRRHGWQVQPDWILGNPGVVSAISTAILAFTEPGDKIIIQPPVYPPFFSCVTKNNRQLVENPLRLVNGQYQMDFEDLTGKLDGVKLLLLCNPHNPVGRSWTRQELLRLGQLCVERGIVIVSDEIHADLILPGSIHTPMASLSPEIASLTVTCMAASKTFNVAGLYTSIALIADRKLRQRFNGILEALDLNGGNLFGITALIAAFEEGEAWLDELLTYLDDNVRYMMDFFAQQVGGITLARPEATYLAWLDCRELQLSQARLKKFFIQEAKVGLNDGMTFGRTGEGFMRLNYGCPRTILEEGLGRIAQAVRLL